MQRASGTVRRMWDASETSWKPHAELREKDTHVFRCRRSYVCLSNDHSIYTWSSYLIGIRPILDASEGGLRHTQMYLYLQLGSGHICKLHSPKWKYVNIRKFKRLIQLWMRHMDGETTKLKHQRKLRERSTEKKSYPALASSWK